jgi:hypothetical protein
VIELRAGALGRANTVIGDTLVVRPPDPAALL